MAEEKTVNIYIPKEYVGDGETMKKVYINDKPYFVPVATNIAVPENVANVLIEWMDNLKRIDDEREARIEALKDK